MIIPGRVRLGQVVIYVGRPLALLFAWDVLVTVAYFIKGIDNRYISFPHLPLPLLGSAIAIYLTFRNNAAYARWWEARTLWGAMINYSRSFGREMQTLLPIEATALQRPLILRHIAYVHALRLHLRRQTPWDELAARLPEDEIARLQQVANVPNAILNETAKIIAREASLDSIRLTTVEHTMRELLNAQGGMERIRNTPFPRQYASYPALFTHVFCILLPLGLVESLGIFTPLGSTAVGFLFLALLQIGNDMEHPFSNTVNDVPLTAITRTIEIDLRDSLGDAHELKPVQAEQGVLW
ncbi:bestrophin family protein [Trinickia mobilis]|uniref:bestrophin family protein n=1 Tax=Trinickia mobilis TaxID=2816356 RepID=UPI001A8C93BE|nr:bestrophin family ion channel [Trinickia mobilis]